MRKTREAILQKVAVGPQVGYLTGSDSPKQQQLLLVQQHHRRPHDTFLFSLVTYHSFIVLHACSIKQWTLIHIQESIVDMCCWSRKRGAYTEAKGGDYFSGQTSVNRLPYQGS